MFGLLAATDAGLVFQYFFTILNSAQVCTIPFWLSLRINEMENNIIAVSHQVSGINENSIRKPFFLSKKADIDEKMAEPIISEGKSRLS